MQIKCTSKPQYHLIPVRMSFIKITYCREYEEKGSRALLAGMSTGTATTENNMGIPQEINNWATIWFSSPTFGYISEGNEIAISKSPSLCTFMLVAVLLTVVKVWRQVFVDGWMDKEIVVHIHNGTLFSLKRGNPDNATR